MAELTLQLLGQPQLCLDEVPLPCRGMGLRLLAILALEGASERLKLADLLWETTTSKALHNLRMTVHQLGLCLGEHSAVLRRHPTFLELDLQQLRVDVLSAPTHPEALLTHWQDFMPGQRSRGSEAWMEWAQRTEDRLMGDHVEHLLRVARMNPEPLSGHLRRRAQQLSAELAPTPVPPVPLLFWSSDTESRQAPVRVPPPSLIGRKQVLDEVLAAVERHQMVFLSGVQGMGKTRLQGILAPLLGQQVMPVISEATDRAWPYTTIYRALRDLQQGLDLGRALPEVPPHEVTARLAQRPEVRRSGELDLLARPLLAEAFQQPFISWGDDIHRWDDASTLVVARHSPGLLAQSPLAGVINTYRPGEVSTRCRQSILQCTDHGRGVIIRLTPLSPEEVAGLSEHFLPGLTDTQIGQLHSYAGGIPGLLVPVLEEAVRQGGLPERLTLGATEDARLHMGLSLLSATELQSLRLLALNDGDPLEVDLLAGVLERPRQTVVDALETLFQSGYMVRYAVHPPALREAVLRHAPPPILADLSTRLRVARAQCSASELTVS